MTFPLMRKNPMSELFSSNMLDRVLDLDMDSRDHRNTTIREYLTALLSAVWEQEEGFSGKRPFGNSGWVLDFVKPLAKAGYIEAEYNSEYPDELDRISPEERAKMREIIRQAIDYTCQKPINPLHSRRPSEVVMTDGAGNETTVLRVPLVEEYPWAVEEEWVEPGECRRCHGERTHWASDAIACPRCNGSGVELEDGYYQ